MPPAISAAMALSNVSSRYVCSPVTMNAHAASSSGCKSGVVRYGSSVGTVGGFSSAQDRKSATAAASHTRGVQSSTPSMRAKHTSVLSPVFMLGAPYKPSQVGSGSGGGVTGESVPQEVKIAAQTQMNRPCLILERE